MILTAHQPVYLPWLGLFHKIALADTFVSFNQVQYLPKDWNNRNKIKTAQGAIWLTVPVLRAGYREKAISDIRINNNEPWQRKHWNSIYLNYKKTPYFEKYASFFEEVYKRRWERITELNEYLLKYLVDILGIKVNFLDASQFNFQGKKNDLVLDMCVRLKADSYIFGELGRDYADVQAFERMGVTPLFQEYQHPVYPQQQGDFISHLSVIDLLFNCGQRSLEIIMEGNVSKEDIIQIKSY